jgi:hypothetical protein
VLAVYGVAHGPSPSGASRRVLTEALARAGGTPVLAEAILAEQFALAGGRVWMSNPLDAFPRADQRLYLDWLAGRPAGRRAFAHAPRAVLARRGSAAQRLTAHSPAWRATAQDDQAVLYVRRP